MRNDEQHQYCWLQMVAERLTYEQRRVARACVVAACWGGMVFLAACSSKPLLGTATEEYLSASIKYMEKGGDFFVLELVNKDPKLIFRVEPGSLKIIEESGFSYPLDPTIMAAYLDTYVDPQDPTKKVKTELVPRQGRIKIPYALAVKIGAKTETITLILEKIEARRPDSAEFFSFPPLQWTINTQGLPRNTETFRTRTENLCRGGARFILIFENKFVERKFEAALAWFSVSDDRGNHYAPDSFEIESLRVDVLAGTTVRLPVVLNRPIARNATTLYFKLPLYFTRYNHHYRTELQWQESLPEELLTSVQTKAPPP